VHPNIDFVTPAKLFIRVFVGLLYLGLVQAQPAIAAESDSAANIASLIDPAKLATLGERGANPRIQKCVYWLAAARTNGKKPSAILDSAIRQAGYTNKLAAKLTKDSLLRNLDIAEKLGCLDEAGLAEMRRGKSPTVMKGPYTGDELSVDHIIPRAVVPELDNVIANLELMPLRMNESKNAKIGSRQRSLAKQFHAAGLLSTSRLIEVTNDSRTTLESLADDPAPTEICVNRLGFWIVWERYCNRIQKRSETATLPDLQWFACNVGLFDGN
jgi:hypothetical protein